ncbi:tyrosine-type recombinase/integrase [Arcicella aurantiaca]|nr:phage integrase SAM-like domain-containing protein [Arcicella aurantiaca]
MKISFYFKYSQTSAKKNQGFGSIYYYLMLGNRKTKEKSTAISCHINEWDAYNKQFIGKDAVSRNLKIKQISDILEQNKLIKEVLNEPFTGDELIEMTTVSERFKKTFLTVLQEYIDEQFYKIRKPKMTKSQANIEESTWRTYQKRQKNIVEFLKNTKKTGIPVADFDARMCELLDNYLTQTGRGQAYATKHVKLVKTVMTFAKSNKLIKVNFAETYKIKPEPKRTVKTLRQEDYDKLEKIRPLLSNTELKYLDVLLFMRETFMHVGDYLETTSENITKYDNGQVWIIKPRVKRIEENNQIQVIPLSETALKIIEKYGSIEQMPHTKQTTINRYIKQACAKADIKLNVSSKCGRSSGISLKYNFGGMRESSIAAIAGWTSTRELVNYLEIDMVQLHNEFLGERA